MAEERMGARIVSTSVRVWVVGPVAPRWAGVGQERPQPRWSKEWIRREWVVRAGKKVW